MQVVFLQTYYSTMKKAETAQLGTEVESAFVTALALFDKCIPTRAKFSEWKEIQYFVFGLHLIF